MSPDELEPVYFVFDPRDEFQQESIDLFVQSASLSFSADQLASTLGHILRIFNELANSEKMLEIFPELSAVQIQAVSDSFEQFHQRLMVFHHETTIDLPTLDTYFGRGKRRIESVLYAVCDSSRSIRERVQLVIALANALAQPVAQCGEQLLDLASLARFHSHPLPMLFQKARRSLIEKSVVAFLENALEQDEHLGREKSGQLLEHLFHAVSLEFDLPYAGAPRYSAELISLVEQAAQHVEQSLRHSAALVHLIQHFSAELYDACRSPQWADQHLLALLSHSGQRINAFCPRQFEYLLGVLNGLGFESTEFHHPVLAECKASVTGLGRQQLLHAGKTMWMCIQSHGPHEEVGRFHRPFCADDLAWFISLEENLPLRVQLLGEHLAGLSELGQDEAPYLAILEKASRPICPMRKWWRFVSGKPAIQSFHWCRALALFALEHNRAEVYRYFSSALSDRFITRLIQRCIDFNENLLPVLRLGQMETTRIQALVSASFHAVWMAQAAEKDRVKMIHFLARHGGDLNVRSVVQRTPLIWATKGASVQAVKALLECGANPLLSYKNGRDLCHYASMSTLDAEAKFILVKKALLASAIRPDHVDVALTWGRQLQAKRSWFKELDPKSCEGYVWAWVSMGMLANGLEDIELMGCHYTAYSALALALEHDSDCVSACMARASCAAIESSNPRGEIIAAFADAFRLRWAQEGKESPSGARPYLADLWASLARMPLWEATPQLSSDESFLITSSAKSALGRVTPLDCLINAIECAPTCLDYQGELEQVIGAYRDHRWMSQADSEFATSIAQDAQAKAQFLCRGLSRAV